MKSMHLAGAGLGLVAAVVFASATTGPFAVRFLLMFLTPLPIALAGLGWGWRSAALSAAVGAALTLVIASPVVSLAFAVTQAAPMVILTYLALLSRPANEGGALDGASDVEWYPAGRLVVWAAVMAGAMGLVPLLVLGGDLESLEKALGELIKSTVASAGLPGTDGPTQLSEAETTALSQLALTVLPGASAVSWMTSFLLNLWLAGRITLASGQIGRPWPDLAAITYPQGTPLAFGLMLLGTMLDGYPGLAASAFAGGLFAAYLLLGLATLHYTTRGRPWRPFALWALYGALLLGNIWVGIGIAVLGLAEPVLNLRARSGAPPGPPPFHSNT